MATRNWVNIGSGNGLLPDGTKPYLAQCWLISLMTFSGISLRAISQQVAKLQFYEISIKSLLIKLVPHLAGANEFDVWNMLHMWSCPNPCSLWVIPMSCSDMTRVRGYVVLKIYVPCKNFDLPCQYLCKPCKAYMYTAEKISTCPDWKISCPVRHVTIKVYVPWDKIYLPRARLNVEPCILLSFSYKNTEICVKMGKNAEMLPR